MQPIVRILPWCFAVFALVAASDPAPKGLPFKTGWDKPVDPDGDCRFLPDKGSLTIEVPGRHHDLIAEQDLMNAPRLLRDVEGDFTAQVRVDGYFRPTVVSTFNRAIPFLAAGLVLMDGDATYARLERAALYRNEQYSRYVNWELRLDGKATKSLGKGPLDDKATYLRLQRKGDRLVASYSQDGEKWTELEPMDAKFPAKVKVGVAVCSTSEVRFKASFDDFRLTAGD